ncbi:MAG: sterol desaturase family protein [Leptospiraceae bacterium]|nr:sterol desaturase family protein [Leptospiraceae bacterium]
MEEFFQTVDKLSAPTLIMYAIPIFLLLIIGEAIFSAYQKRGYYRMNDTINDLTMGIYSRIAGVFVNAGLLVAYFGLYYVLYDIRLFADLPMDSVLAWAACFLLVDHQYYWFHRMSHQVAVIWGSHEPHHQSEEYNLAVALRQGSFQGIFSLPFYLPLALIGFHPFMFFACSQINTIYQFWIHTRAMGKLGFLETFLNTPSHHRVHHGINPKYIDKNHAGTLIIWDKLYGTFQEEEEEPVYGTVKPLASWNPIWANFQYWLHLMRMSRRVPGLMNKIKVWIMPPGWKPAELGPNDGVPEVDAATFQKYDPRIPAGLNLYVLLNFIVGLGLALGCLIVFGLEGKQFTGTVWLTGLLSFFSLFVLGAILDRRSWAAPLEIIRLVAALMLGLYLGYQSDLRLTGKIALLSLEVMTFIALFEWFMKYRTDLRSPTFALMEQQNQRRQAA